jgi:penicillin G amidase
MKFTTEPKNITIGNHSATIFRDSNGVIQIDTEDPVSLAKFTGYAHAIDRQMQMMLLRTVAEGRLCEYFKDDDETLEIDIFMREMAFYHEAEKEVSQITNENLKFIQAYCDGVNFHLERSTGPVEFKLIGYAPKPWKIADSLVSLKIMSYIGLAQTQLDIEKFILLALKNETPLNKLQSLFFPHLEGVTQETINLLKKTNIYRETIPKEIKFLSIIPKLLASNNWVIGSKKSKSGHPIHCADPHLETNRLPAIWYEIVATTVNNYYMGITMPGVPGLIMGRNNKVAFSFSYGFMDMVDYFIEDIQNGKFLDEVNGNQSYHQLIQRTEVIKRKKHRDFKFNFYETPRGPIEIAPCESAIDDGLYLARAWSGHKNSTVGSLNALMDIHRVSNVKDAMKTVSKITISCNWLLSDTNGNIGYQQSGLLPNRKHSGLHPLPGYKEENQWAGICKTDALSSRYNPPEGFLVTANNDLNQQGKPLSINMPMGTYRADRIKTLLKNTDLLDIEDMMEIQKDLYSLQAKNIIELIFPFIQNSGKAELLNRWDLRYDKNSTGATVFEELYKEILIEVFGGQCFGKDVFRHLLDHTSVITDYYYNFDKILLSDGYDHSQMWFKGNRPDLLKSIILKFLGKLNTKKIKKWGDKNKVVMKNIFFDGSLPQFLGFDYGPIPVEGGRATVVQGAIFQSAGRTTTFCPSWRFITEMNHDFCYTVLAGGVSDRRYSKLYLSDVDNWINYKFKTLNLDMLNSLDSQ